MGAFLLWNNGSNSMFFDVVVNESQNKSAMITEHPVEKGANITDHIRPNLDRVVLEGFISQTPIFTDKGSQQSIVLDIPKYSPPLALTPGFVFGAIENAISSLLSPNAQTVANVLVVDDGTDFVSEAIDTLEQLRTTGTLITVVCPNWIYDNMAIEDIQVERSADTGTGASITVSFKEIRTVSSSLVAAPAPTIPRALISKSKGAQAAVDSSKQSVLSSILAAVSGG